MPGLFRIDGLKLAPETRLILALAGSVAALVARDFAALAVLIAASMVYLLLQLRVRTALWAYFFLSLLALSGLAGVWLMGFIFEAMRGDTFSLALLPFGRLGLTLNLVLPLALQTSLTGLAGTLNRLKLPGLLKLPLIVTLRFIPTFLSDFKQLREAVTLRFRGRGGLRFWLVRPVVWWRVIFLPLVVRLIRSADELAVASELKGLSAETDFGRAELTWSASDRGVMLAAVLTLVTAALLEAGHVAA
ncbi:MAG: energy-coupling factor transporter transmembrane protein EcfT [Candidatus Adiutrix sp.]|jgi:energy-coupling factor transport system permease protein|nr:energy-coupling factor transporter transmembrane protein EcfT [Candidatus Adiutrix sp.]